MPKDLENPNSPFAMAAARPPSQAAWDRQCEIEQDAMRDFFRQRALLGHSAAATALGAVFEGAHLASAVPGTDRDKMRDMLLDAIRTAFNGGSVDGKS